MKDRVIIIVFLLIAVVLTTGMKSYAQRRDDRKIFEEAGKAQLQRNLVAAQNYADSVSRAVQSSPDSYPYVPVQVVPALSYQVNVSSPVYYMVPRGNYNVYQNLPLVIDRSMPISLTPQVYVVTQWRGY